LALATSKVGKPHCSISGEQVGHLKCAGGFC